MKVVRRIINWLVNISLIFFGVLFLYAILKIFVFDSFPVNTTSMFPTIQPGDRILVNKMIFGARIYKSLDFEEGKPLKSWRMPGWRNIRHNDVVVFNYPKGSKTGQISFNFSTVYVKRCIGLPGDTLSIRNGFFYNTSLDAPLGLIAAQQQLADADTLSYKGLYHALKHARPHGWNILNAGPLYIPKKGTTTVLTPLNYRLYKGIIEYETQGKTTIEGDSVFLDGIPIDEYQFQGNYYFMCGDYLINSVDSRSWGVIPEDFIIGVSPRVLYAKNARGKMNWNRFLKTHTL